MDKVFRRVLCTTYLFVFIALILSLCLLESQKAEIYRLETRVNELSQNVQDVAETSERENRLLSAQVQFFLNGEWR